MSSGVAVRLKKICTHGSKPLLTDAQATMTCRVIAEQEGPANLVSAADNRVGCTNLAGGTFDGICMHHRRLMHEGRRFIVRPLQPPQQVVPTRQTANPAHPIPPPYPPYLLGPDPSAYYPPHLPGPYPSAYFLYQQNPRPGQMAHYVDNAPSSGQHPPCGQQQPPIQLGHYWDNTPSFGQQHPPSQVDDYVYNAPSFGIHHNLPPRQVPHYPVNTPSLGQKHNRPRGANRYAPYSRQQNLPHATSFGQLPPHLRQLPRQTQPLLNPEWDQDAKLAPIIDPDPMTHLQNIESFHERAFPPFRRQQQFHLEQSPEEPPQRPAQRSTADEGKEEEEGDVYQEDQRAYPGEDEPVYHGEDEPADHGEDEDVDNADTAVEHPVYEERKNENADKS
jgi:hypothetical protein